MKYKKFRNLKVDIYDIKFKKIKIKKILNFMPAGNDVIEILSEDNQNYFVKIERSEVADFNAEYNNILKLKKVNYSKVPEIVEFIDIANLKCLVLKKIEGKRLNDIVNQNNKDYYLYNLGMELAIIHSIDSKTFNTSRQRVVNDIPYDGLYCKVDRKVQKYVNFLVDNDYDKNLNTFIHGDFHYANVLWKNKKISGILDWEYSGLGHKEQDIAWSLIVRPNQKFLNSIEDIFIFLRGYKQYGNYDGDKLKWCLINGYLHFYLMNDDSEYKKLLIQLMNTVMKSAI